MPHTCRRRHPTGDTCNRDPYQVIPASYWYVLLANHPIHLVYLFSCRIPIYLTSRGQLVKGSSRLCLYAQKSADSPLSSELRPSDHFPERAPNMLCPRTCTCLTSTLANQRVHLTHVSLSHIYIIFSPFTPSICELESTGLE